MHIALFTDAWRPQVNGVVRTWENVIAALATPALGGHRVHVTHPNHFQTVPAPKYPEIRLAVAPGRQIRALLDRHVLHAAPDDPDRIDAIHIATEGPIGRTARRWCRTHGVRYTTSYHTQFPQYLNRYFRIPEWTTYTFVKWFHGASHAVLVPTQRVNDELTAKGVDNVVTWRRGVDTQQFHPTAEAPGFRPRFDGLPRPVFLSVGRVAVEKNIAAFAEADLPGTKVIVGDGPARDDLAAQYPDIHWAGTQTGADLADHYRDADVFVFPSTTDTYGVVMLEANACGLPVAAYPVTGPIDVVVPGVTGVLDADLATAAQKALDIDPAGCIAHARRNTWAACAHDVLDHLAPIG